MAAGSGRAEPNDQLKKKASREELIQKKSGRTSRKGSQKRTWRSGSWELLPWTWSGSVAVKDAVGKSVRTHFQLSLVQVKHNEEEHIFSLVQTVFSSGRKQHEQSQGRLEAVPASAENKMRARNLSR